MQESLKRLFWLQLYLFSPSITYSPFQLMLLTIPFPLALTVSYADNTNLIKRTSITCKRINTCWWIMQALSVPETTTLPEFHLGVILTEYSLPPPKLIILLFPSKGSLNNPTKSSIGPRWSAFYPKICWNSQITAAHLEEAHLWYCCGGISNIYLVVWHSVSLFFSKRKTGRERGLAVRLPHNLEFLNQDESFPGLGD